MWAGLGYYRRARFLLEGAKYVQSTLSGQMPVTAVELQKIPGQHCKPALLPSQLDAPSPHQTCRRTCVSDTGRPSQNIKSNMADLAYLQLQSLHQSAVASSFPKTRRRLVRLFSSQRCTVFKVRADMQVWGHIQAMQSLLLRVMKGLQSWMPMLSVSWRGCASCLGTARATQL